MRYSAEFGCGVGARRVPVVGKAVLRRVLTHCGHNDTVTQRNTAEREGLGKRCHRYHTGLYRT